MYCVYVLKLNEDKIYVGCTHDLKQRYKQHKEKQVKSTKNYEVELVYYEAYKAKADAITREAKLKQRGNAKRFLKEKIQNSLQ